jgi:hypothetical protein
MIVLIAFRHLISDKIIIPMLTYGSEIWGYENIDILEKVHVKFCKLLLNLKTSTTIYIYGEIGRYPLNIHMFEWSGVES